MDIINNRTRDIAAMALDGLYERSKAISSNTANALTPGYQRKEVSFEKSLQDVMKNEDLKEQIKIDNSVKFQQNGVLSQTPEQVAFLSSQSDNLFRINIENDARECDGLDGNNVNIETEMMDEAETGMKYQLIAGLLSKSYAMMKDVITGQNS